MQSIYLDITVIICLAALLAFIFRLLKQPLLLAYILTGILLGPLGLFRLHSYDTLQTLGQLGVTFLLFMLGLELKLRDLRSIGLPAIIIGTLQVWFTFFLGFYLAFFLGFAAMTSIYLGIAASFSSTIIIVKILSDKKDLNSLHGKLSIGILLLQDFFAVLAIILLNGFHAGGSTSIGLSIVILLFKFSFLVVMTVFIGIKIMPSIMHIIARSQELLFLFSLAWVFAVTAIVTSPVFGFSIEIGGFLAGIALASSFENYQIIARMKALRDFFITIFYVVLGLSLSFLNMQTMLIPALLLFLFVAFIKPVLIMVLTGLAGYRKRPAFFVGMSMGQASEFSFLLMFLGNKAGYVPNTVVTMFLMVGIAGYITSTYFMQHANSLYKKMGRYLNFLESNTHLIQVNGSADTSMDISGHIILVGGHQLGRSFIQALEESDEKIIVIDFDPDIVKYLVAKKIWVVFGDIADPDIQEAAHIELAKLIVSTIPDLEDNLLLMEGVRHRNKKAKIIVCALENEDARMLYKAGADYVVLPHLSGGRYLAKMLKDSNLETMEWHKARDMAYIS